MKENQSVTTTVKTYFVRKIQSIKEFHQIGNEIPLILHGSINERNPKMRGFIILQRTFPQITQKVLTTIHGLELIIAILSFPKMLR